MRAEIIKYSKMLVKLLIVLKLSSYIILPLWFLFPLPERDTVSASIPDVLYVESDEVFEHNPPNQCAGFATAYVLRNSGINAKGASIYEDIPCKIPFSGYVLPNGIFKHLKEYGLAPEVYTGTIDTLKIRLAEGNPVIVLVGRHVKWQHYMVLLGFNQHKKQLYFFDSKQVKDTNGKQPGNRTLSEEYFLSLWDNKLPLFNHLYITAENS